MMAPQNAMAMPQADDGIEPFFEQPHRQQQRDHRIEGDQQGRLARGRYCSPDRNRLA